MATGNDDVTWTDIKVEINSSDKEDDVPKNNQERAKEKLQKQLAKERKKRANETAEEREARLEQRRRSTKLREATKTAEEKQARLERRRETARVRMAKEAPEQREKRLERKRQRWSQTGPDKKRKRNESRREKERFYSHVKRLTMTDEEKERLNKQRYFYRQANKDRRSWKNLPEEERERLKQRAREWKDSLTGEKKERHQESVARALRKSQQKQYDRVKSDPELLKEFKRKLSDYQKQRYANESPEERKKRRYKDKVNQKKSKLRRTRREQGVSEEEIEGEVKALGEKMWKEFYPDGIIPPPPKRGPPRRELTKREPTAVQLLEDPDGEVTAIPEEDITEVWVFPTVDTSPPADSPMGEECWFPMGVVEEGDIGAEVVLLRNCLYCAMKFSCDALLRSHVFCLHPSKCLQCPKCRQVVLTPQELSEHYHTAHKTTAPAQTQETNHNQPQAAIEVIVATDVPWNFVCVKCPIGQLGRFRTRKDLFAHVKAEHSKSFWPCENCNLLKYSERSLGLHRRLCRATCKS